MYLHRNWLSIDLHGTVKNPGYWVFFIKVHLDDKDRKPSTKINTLENDANNVLLPWTTNFHPTPFFKELNMSSQYAITFDHCPKFGMFDITT